MSQTTHVATLDASVQKTNEWLKELSGEMGVERDTAYKVLRGYLQTVRDCLDVGEASDLAAQLPIVLRGLYYTGWDPSDVPMSLDRDGFLEAMRDRAVLRADDPDPDAAARAVTALLRRQVTAGALTDVYAQLRDDVRKVVAPDD